MASTDSRRRHEPMITEVIVIGAGLSGLQAAVNLQEAGVKCIVLEARARVGGKVWTAKPQGWQGKMDLGAAWTNSENQPCVMGLAREFGIEMIPQNIKGDVVVQGHGQFRYGEQPSIPTSDQEAYTRVINSVEKLCHKVDLLRPDTSLPEYRHMNMDELAASLGATDLVRRFVNIWTSAMLGVASTDTSAIYFLHYCRCGGGLLQMRSDDKGGGQHLRFRSGTQTLATGLSDRLEPGSVHFSEVVAEVQQSLESGCVVTTRDGHVFRSKKVISTVPSPLLQEMSISPPLSVDKKWLVSQSRLGFYAKVYLSYAEPWWREAGLCGLSQGFDGPVTLTRDTSSDADGFFALTCFVVGKSGRRWSREPSRKKRLQQVLVHIDRIYGRSCPEPKGAQEQLWNDEEFSQGAPCPVVPAGCLEALSRDQWRAEGHLHFAGTETSTIWKGYMEGALISGARMAGEVIDNLRPERARAATRGNL